VSVLIDDYDAAFFDLDGVIYLGPEPVPGAVQALAEIGRRGTRVMYVTNNAARPARVVIDQLRQLGFAAESANVLTSAQVAAAMLPRELPAGAKVLVCGSANLAGLLEQAGFRIVASADDRPDAVIQGYDPDLSWRRLDEATLAIQNGARWYATNDDASRPTHRGLVPGVGGQIAVVATALGGEPVTFGKPFRPMLDVAVSRTGAVHPIFVGDRLDTDIEGAVAAGMDSMLVLSGAHGKHDLVHAGPEAQPTYIGRDVGALLEPPRVAVVADGRAECGAQVAVARSGRIELDHSPEGVSQQLDALWAATRLAWLDPRLDAGPALTQLDRLP
jgi:HAD superfamily hydrolase (TIGR01450 family)